MPKEKKTAEKKEKKEKKGKKTKVQPAKVEKLQATGESRSLRKQQERDTLTEGKPAVKKKVTVEEPKDAKIPEPSKAALTKNIPAKESHVTKPRGRPKKIAAEAQPETAQAVVSAPVHKPARKVVEKVKTAVPKQAPVEEEKKAEVKKEEPIKEPAPVKEKEQIKKEEFPKIKINELTTLREIAEKISLPTAELIKKLLSMKIMATINQRLDPDMITLLLHEFKYEAEFVSLYTEEFLDYTAKEDVKKLKHRAPVVTVMGHVDHGKTTLLDTIRKTKVAEKEHGGITQHIGAYKVKTPKGDIVFLDTPGHEAFTSMRAHGTKITDIVILVVSADDGIMPQTVEAIDHARNAAVPIIVAINKIDLPNVNPQNIKQQLTKYNLMPDDWGGDTLMVEISARNNVNIDKLLEAILFKAELMDLKSNPDKPASGVIIEAHLDSKRGPLPTVLVQSGTLNISDVLISGMTYGKVRALLDENGHRVISAAPGTPVEVMGFDGLPRTGDKFVAIKDERLARDIVKRRRDILVREKTISRRRISLDDLSSGKLKQLNMILKADVFGSLEAIRDTLERVSHEEVEIKVIHAGVGAINESDINLAIASGAVIIGFNVRPTPNADAIAKDEGVDIRTYRIIYQLVEDIKKALAGMSTPKTKETVAGHAEIRKIYKVSNAGTVAGCLVKDGKALKIAKIRLLRDSKIIFDGSMASLKRFKDDVKEVEKGYECGILLEGYNDIKAGDILEFYIMEEIKPV